MMKTKNGLTRCLVVVGGLDSVCFGAATRLLVRTREHKVEVLAPNSRRAAYGLIDRVENYESDLKVAGDAFAKKSFVPTAESLAKRPSLCFQNNPHGVCSLLMGSFAISYRRFAEGEHQGARLKSCLVTDNLVTFTYDLLDDYVANLYSLKQVIGKCK